MSSNRHEPLTGRRGSTAAAKHDMLGDEERPYAAHAEKLRRVVGAAVCTSEANIEDACSFAWLQLLRRARGERCGSISASDIPCKGDVYLDEVNEGTYELSVDNFSAGSSASCRPGPGDHFTPQRNGTLRYRTGYDGSIAGTLSKAPE